MTTTEAPPGARIYGAVSEDTKQAQRAIRARLSNSETKEEGSMEHRGQKTFWDWANQGVSEASEDFEKPIAKLIELAKALTAMATQAKAQPAFIDKLNAVQRAALNASNLSKAADALAREMESGE